MLAEEPVPSSELLRGEEMPTERKVPLPRVFPKDDTLTLEGKGPICEDVVALVPLVGTTLLGEDPVAVCRL